MATNKVFSLKLKDVKWLWLLSIFVALVFDTMILVSAQVHFAPSVTLLVLIFWMTQVFEQTHLLTAFVLGLLFDAILASPLGAHALLFVTLGFMILRVRQSFKAFPIWQQSLIVTLYYGVFQALSWLLLSPNLPGYNALFYFLEPLFAGLLWPFLMALLTRLTQSMLFR